MESVGQELRGERLRAGLTLEQVSAKTRISVNNLQAIENDDLPKINSPFFYKSFVRQFAECVRLDFNRLADAVLTAANTMPQPLMPGQELAGEAGAELRKIPAIRIPRVKGFRWLSSIASLGIMMVGCSTIYAVWKNVKRDWHSPSLRFVAAVSPKPKTPAELKQPAVSSPNTQTAQGSRPQAVLPHSGASDAEPKASSQSDSIPESQADSPVTSNSQSAQVNGTPESERAVHVELSAVERTWLSVSEDGKETFNGILEADETKVLEGHETARIRTGNAGGLNLVFNGKPLGTIGPRGQVRTIVFTRDNYEVLEPSPHISLTHFNSGLE